MYKEKVIIGVLPVHDVALSFFGKMRIQLNKELSVHFARRKLKRNNYENF